VPAVAREFGGGKRRRRHGGHLGKESAGRTGRK
jgi:hypothetical protein